MQRMVRYGGTPMALTVTEYRLLEVLLQRQGACCSRAELLAEVWQGGPEGGSTNIVDVYITYLRKKLMLARPLDPSAAAAIETVRGEGYRLRRERRVTDGPAIGRRAGDRPMELAIGA